MNRLNLRETDEIRNVLIPLYHEGRWRQFVATERTHQAARPCNTTQIAQMCQSTCRKASICRGLRKLARPRCCTKRCDERSAGFSEPCQGRGEIDEAGYEEGIISLPPWFLSRDIVDISRGIQRSLWSSASSIYT